MKRHLFFLAIVLCVAIPSCQNKKKAISSEAPRSLLLHDSVKMGSHTNPLPTQDKSHTDGVIATINFAVEDQGAVTIIAEGGAEKQYRYSKAKTHVDSSFVNKRVRIFWSIQVDTTLDEANSYFMVDSIVEVSK